MQELFLPNILQLKIRGGIFRKDKQWKLNKYFKSSEINDLNTEFRKEVFGDDDKIIVVYGGNSWGDGIFPICIDHDNKIIIQCGRILVNFIIWIGDIIKDKETEINLIEYSKK